MVRRKAITASLPAAPSRSFGLIVTRMIYCGDNLEKLRKLLDGCVELVRVLKKAGNFHYPCDWHAGRQGT